MPDCRRFGLSDDKMLDHAGFKPVLCVAAGKCIAVSHELRHHRILGRDELDDNVGLEAREPGDQLRERYVPSDRQMVNERKRQDQIRTRTRLKCLTLLVAPPQTRGRVGEVADQRKDRRVLFNLGFGEQWNGKYG